MSFFHRFLNPRERLAQIEIRQRLESLLQLPPVLFMIRQHGQMVASDMKRVEVRAPGMRTIAAAKAI